MPNIIKTWTNSSQNEEIEKKQKKKTKREPIKKEKNRREKNPGRNGTKHVEI